MNDNNRPALDMGRVFAIVGARWKTVLAITVLAAMAAYGYVTFVAKPVYEATALVTYQSPDRATNPTNGALPSTGITREDIGTLVANATNGEVVETAAAKASTTPADLRRAARVQAHGEASIVAFIAKSGSAEEAAAMANAWASAFVAERRAKALVSLDALVKQKQAALNAAKKVKQNPENPDFSLKTQAQGELSNAQSLRTQWSGAISVSNAAQVPDAAIWPKKTLTMLAAILIGLGMGMGVALLTARVDQRLRSDDVDQLPAPVLARVPMSPRAPKSAPLGPTSAEPIVADAFAALGSRVMLDRVGDGAHVILVTSARSGEGKSSVAANLASALALGGRRVVLVDADMRRPTQDLVFPMLANRPGLSQVLTRATELETALTLVAPNLAAVGSGPRHPNASVLLASVALRQMIDRLAQISEVIVIDAPPVLAVNDALAVAPAASQVLLVARQDSSDLGEVNEAHKRIASAAQTPQAVVLVGTERPQGYGYDHELRMASRMSMPAPAPQAIPSASTASVPVGPPPAAPGSPAAAAAQAPPPPPAANGDASSVQGAVA